MISWIQNHLIRHGRWIFICLLTVIIVAFVFTIGNTPGCTTNTSYYQEQEFYGYDLNSKRDMELVQSKAAMSAQVSGTPLRSSEQLVQRIALVHLADQIGIPAPDQDTLADYIKTKRSFLGPDGTFSVDAYTAFTDSLESNPAIPAGLFISTMEEDYRIEQLSEVLAGPGYVLPSEARIQTQRNQTSYKLATGSLSYSDFAPETASDDAAVKAYFEANKQSYEIPARIIASYVQFDTEKFVDAEATVDDVVLREYFVENRARFASEYEATLPEPAEGEEKPTVTFELVKDAVAKAYQLAQAETKANTAASEFAYRLYDQAVERDSATFNSILNDAGLSLQKIEPFTAAGASQRALSPQMLQAAFDLSDQRYYSDAYAVPGGYAVLIYQDRIAPELPAYESVAAEVEAAYLSEEKRRLFNEHGETLAAELKAKVEGGSNFMDAAEGLGLTVAEFESFKSSEAPRELNRTALQQAQNMEPGEISDMLRSGDEGIFVFVETKDVPEIGDDNEDFTQAEDWLKQYSTYISTQSAMNELISKGMPATPEQAADDAE
ncbi:MAG: hypothetical protein ACPGJU_00430 [Coraliomargarita sp.]